MPSLFFLIREGVNTHSEGRWVFLWPLPLSQDEATPPVEAPLFGCYVESWLTAFPPFMVGVPELFLERCLSSISWRDGSLYIQTGSRGDEGQRRGEERRGRGEVERLKRWMWRQRQGQAWGWRDNHTKLVGIRWRISSALSLLDRSLSFHGSIQQCRRRQREKKMYKMNLCIILGAIKGVVYHHTNRQLLTLWRLLSYLVCTVLTESQQLAL